MTRTISNTYHKEKLLAWERKSLMDKYSMFSWSKRSTWSTLGLLILGCCVFGLIVPFIPPRYGSGNWTPATTANEYKLRLTSYLIAVPVMIFAVFGYINIRNKLDLTFGIKWTANFRVTEVLNLGIIKILLMNGWRPFSIKTRQPYFSSVAPRNIITIKRTCTFRLMDYYIRDASKFNSEEIRRY